MEAPVVSGMQELSQADKEEIGRVPRTLEIELTRDLVDSCSAGDVVTVLGIIKVLSTDAEAGNLLILLWRNQVECAT